jgi:hypothetical protein
VKKIEFRAHAGMAEMKDLSRSGPGTAEKQEKRFLYSSAYAGWAASPSSISGSGARVEALGRALRRDAILTVDRRIRLGVIACSALSLDLQQAPH